MHVLICNPLPDALNLAGCFLCKLKVHVQVLFQHDSLSVKVLAEKQLCKDFDRWQIGCVGLDQAYHAENHFVNTELYESGNRHRQAVSGLLANFDWHIGNAASVTLPQSRWQMQQEPDSC